MEAKPKKFNLLELLSRAKDYEINQWGDTSFEIADKRSNLVAKVSGDKITYYTPNCEFNSYGDCVEIDMKALNKLKAFCECITLEIE